MYGQMCVEHQLVSKRLYLHGSLFLAEAGLHVSLFSKKLPLCCPAVIKDMSLPARHKIAPGQELLLLKILTRFNRPPFSFGKTGSSLRGTLNLFSASSRILV